MHARRQGATGASFLRYCSWACELTCVGEDKCSVLIVMYCSNLIPTGQQIEFIARLGCRFDPCDRDILGTLSCGSVLTVPKFRDNYNARVGTFGPVVRTPKFETKRTMSACRWARQMETAGTEYGPVWFSAKAGLTKKLVCPQYLAADWVGAKNLASPARPTHANAFLANTRASHGRWNPSPTRFGCQIVSPVSCRFLFHVYLLFSQD